MNTRELKKNLQLLSRLRVGGEPSSVWMRDTRSTLLSRVQTDLAHDAPVPAARAIGNALFSIDAHSFFGALTRPAFALTMSLFVLMSGWAGAVSASISSVPGDRLYTVKRATEKAQLALAPTADARARLSLEFVSRRVEEVSHLAEQPAKSDQKEQLAMAVTNLRSDVNAVETEIAAIKKEQPAAAADLAKTVDRKTDELHNTLEKASAGKTDSPEVQEAKNIVMDASVKAVALILDTDASVVSPAELASTVSEKIAAVKLTIANMQEAMKNTSSTAAKSSAAQAQLALTEATARAAKSDLSGALVKVLEGKSLANTAAYIASVNSDPKATTTAVTTSTPKESPVPEITITLPSVTNSTSTTTVTSTPDTTVEFHIK